MSCARAPDRLFDWLPNFARACGRVSVGGHRDKKPDSRLRKNLLPCTRDRQPEAKPAQPALPGRRGLKQRRNGLFWSLPAARSGYRRGLSFFAGRADRELPFRTKAAIG